MFDSENLFSSETSHVGKGPNLAFFNIFKNYSKVKLPKLANLSICSIGDRNQSCGRRIEVLPSYLQRTL